MGHLAVQYAHKLGCAPIVFSRSATKEGDALALGAEEFHVVEDGKPVQLPAGKGVDVLLLCSGRLPDLGLFMGALGRRARIVPLIIQVEDMVVPYVMSGFLFDGRVNGLSADVCRYMPFMLPGHTIM